MENRIEELERKIKNKKELIEEIEKRNPNNENLSFDYYELHCLEEELEELKNK